MCAAQGSQGVPAFKPRRRVGFRRDRRLLLSFFLGRFLQHVKEQTMLSHVAVSLVALVVAPALAQVRVGEPVRSSAGR